MTHLSGVIDEVQGRLAAARAVVDRGNLEVIRGLTDTKIVRDVMVEPPTGDKEEDKRKSNMLRQLGVEGMGDEVLRGCGALFIRARHRTVDVDMQSTKELKEQ